MARRFKGKQLHKPLEIDGDLTVTGAVSSSFYGDGSGLTNINVSDLDLFQIVSGSTTAMVDKVLSGPGNIFIVKRNNIELFKINTSGVVIYNNQLTTPTYVSGGIMYSASNIWVGLDD